MNTNFEICIRVGMIGDLTQEQKWIKKVFEKFPNLPKKYVDKLTKDYKKLEDKKVEIQEEINEIKERTA